MLPKLKLLLPLSVAALVACGGDDGPTAPAAPNIGGSWVYNTSNLTGSGISCSSSGTALQINQQQATFSGTYSGGTLTCTGPGGTFSGPIGNGTVVNGTLAGTTVAFDLDTQDWHNSGSVSGTSMSGTARVTYSDGTNTYVLNGSFAASR